MFYVYVIYNKLRDKIYIGHTSNLIKRIERHNGLLRSKATSYTYKNKGEWKLVYKEGYNTREKALMREKQIKSFQGRKFARKKAVSWAGSSVGRAIAS